MNLKLLLVVLICGVLVKDLLADQHGLSRQKRCIVVQKQSGTHGDSTEGEEDRGPEVKEREPHKRRRADYGDLHMRDVEKIQPERLKSKLLPVINNAGLRARNIMYKRFHY